MIIDWLVEPFAFTFMTRAFWGTTLIALLAAVVGTFIVLKGLAFIGDAIAHTSFSGLALALFLGINIYLGAFALAMLTALGVVLLTRVGKVKNDTALAILFTGAFAFGVILMSTMPNFAGDLTALLLGSVMAIRPQELTVIVVAFAVIVVLVVVFYNRLVFIVFDPVGAEASGLPVVGLQLLLMSLVAITVVVSIQAVGVVLVVALLTTPAATASLFTRKLRSMIVLAALFGTSAAWIGLYMSYYLSSPPGAAIVLVATGEFALAMVFSQLKDAYGRAMSRTREHHSELG